MAAPGTLLSPAAHAALTTAAVTQTSPLEVAAKVLPPLAAAAYSQKAAAQYAKRTGHVTATTTVLAW